MKKLVIRTVLGLTLLLTLGAVFGGVNPSTVRADAPHRVNCTDDTFRIDTDNGADWDCFDGTGTIDVMIYNADIACTGAHTGSISWQNDGQEQKSTNFPSERICGAIDPNNLSTIAHRSIVNQVHSITIGN